MTTTTPVGFAPEELEQYRRELTGYCYRMLGSAFEADDAVQDTLVRAWQKSGSFEGRSAVRSWLYRIATNVCLDMLRSRKRRARPVDMGPATAVQDFTPGTLPESVWVQPMPDVRVLPGGGDPAELADDMGVSSMSRKELIMMCSAQREEVLNIREQLAELRAEHRGVFTATRPGLPNSAPSRTTSTGAPSRPTAASTAHARRLETKLKELQVGQARQPPSGWLEGDAHQLSAVEFEAVAVGVIDSAVPADDSRGGARQVPPQVVRRQKPKPSRARR